MNINDDRRPQGESVTERRDFRDGEENDNRSVQGEGSLKGDEPWGNAASYLANTVERRFGVFPNFFRLAPETPEITEKLWGFAQAAYLDNPLPSVFKERLFVHLSRFCAVRYCIARHAGFLLGLGHPSGDAQARVQSVGEVVKLLRRPFPRGHDLATEHPQTTKARPIHLTFRNLDEALFQRSL